MFSPRLQRYIKDNVDAIKERAVIKEDEAVKAIAQSISNATTW
jgi:hypothetical protein